MIAKVGHLFSGKGGFGFGGFSTSSWGRGATYLYPRGKRHGTRKRILARSKGRSLTSVGW